MRMNVKQPTRTVRVGCRNFWVSGNTACWQRALKALVLHRKITINHLESQTLQPPACAEFSMTTRVIFN